MAKYRKKPVVIEARQWEPGARSSTRRDLIAWMNENGCRAGYDGFGRISVPTLEGAHVASPGDWIIQGVKGEFYPCKPDILALTYEPAAETPTPKGP